MSRRRPGKNARSPARPRLPIIIAAEVNRRQYVARCCPLAAAAGVSPAMDISQAAALCPQAQVHPWQPDIYQPAIEKLAQWAGRFSPRVMIDPTPHEIDAGFAPAPHGLLIDASGMEHLHGGCRVLLVRIQQALAALGFTARLAAASTIGSAWALAHYGAKPIAYTDATQLPQALAHLPMAALRMPRAMCESLSTVGIVQIQHLTCIPRISLLERFGPHLLQRMDQSYGRVHEDIAPFTIRPVLSVSQLFDGPVTQLEVILNAARQLVHQLSSQLMDRQRGAETLEVRLARPDHQDNIKKISLVRPVCQPDRIWDILRPSLERMHLGSGVEAIVLKALRTAPVKPRQAEMDHVLPATDAAADDLLQLLDRLINHWGPRCLLMPDPQASHIPECTGRKSPVMNQGDLPASEVNWPPLDRPSILLDPPEPAQCVALQPDHPPHRLGWRGGNYAVISQAGPERIVPYRTLTHRQTRDYFKLQLEDGRWVWVYHAREDGRWFVHGLWG